MPLLSILIITYNRPQDTLSLLENIQGQNNLLQYVGEVLLLNNASSDSYESVEDFIKGNPGFPIQYIEHNQNLGVAGGRNFLIKKAKYPTLLLLDDDVVFPEKNAMEKLAVLFEKPFFKENNTAVITLNIYYFLTRERQKSALPHKDYAAYKNKQRFLTSYFTGAAHLMKKELFEQTGYYPEDFFYGMEEYDLSYRIIEAGYTLAFDNSVKVLHKESPTGRITPKKRLGLFMYNKSIVAWRYLPRKYFYSTAFMWSLHYLKMSKFDIPGLFKNLKKVNSIPKNILPQKIGPNALSYLKKVNARLWY